MTYAIRVYMFYLPAEEDIWNIFLLLSQNKVEYAVWVWIFYNKCSVR